MEIKKPLHFLAATLILIVLMFVIIYNFSKPPLGVDFATYQHLHPEQMKNLGQYVNKRVAVQGMVLAMDKNRLIHEIKSLPKTKEQASPTPQVIPPSGKPQPVSPDPRMQGTSSPAPVSTGIKTTPSPAAPASPTVSGTPGTPAASPASPAVQVNPDAKPSPGAIPSVSPVPGASKQAPEEINLIGYVYIMVDPSQNVTRYAEFQIIDFFVVKDKVGVMVRPGNQPVKIESPRDTIRLPQVPYESWVTIRQGAEYSVFGTVQQAPDKSFYIAPYQITSFPVEEVQSLAARMNRQANFKQYTLIFTSVLAYIIFLWLTGAVSGASEEETPHEEEASSESEPETGEGKKPETGASETATKDTTT